MDNELSGGRLWNLEGSLSATSEYITTDLTVPLEETARQLQQQELRKMSGNQPPPASSHPNPRTSFHGSTSSAQQLPASFQSVPQVALPAQGIVSVPPPNAQVIGPGMQPIRGINIQIAGGQVIQQVTPRSSVAQPVTFSPTVLTLSQSGQNGAMLSPPIQVISAIPFQQLGTMASTTPVSMVTGSQAQLPSNISFQGGTVLMPVQPAGLARLPVQQSGVSRLPMQQAGVARIPVPVQQANVTRLPMQQTTIARLPVQTTLAKSTGQATTTSVRQVVPTSPGSSRRNIQPKPTSITSMLGGPTVPVSSVRPQHVVHRGAVTPHPGHKGPPPGLGRLHKVEGVPPGFRPVGQAAVRGQTIARVGPGRPPGPAQITVPRVHTGSPKLSRKGPYRVRSAASSITVPRPPPPRPSNQVRFQRGPSQPANIRQPRPAHCNMPQQRPVLNIPQQVGSMRLAVGQHTSSGGQLRPIAPAPSQAHIGLRIPVPSSFLSQPINLQAQVVSSLQAGGVIPRTPTSQPPARGSPASSIAVTTPGSMHYSNKLVPPAAHSGGFSTRSPLASPAAMSQPRKNDTEKMEPLNLHISTLNMNDLDDLEPGEIRRVPAVSTMSATPPVSVYKSDQSPAPPAMLGLTARHAPATTPTAIKRETGMSSLKQEPQYRSSPPPLIKVKQESSEESEEEGEEKPEVKEEAEMVLYKNTDSVPIEYDNPEFVWQDFLEETGATAAPPTAFAHVEVSLKSGFEKGMKVEVPHKGAPGTYWVATLKMCCGPLLQLRFEGYGKDSSGDFWCQLATSEVRPLGWCRRNNKLLVPPEAIKDRQTDWVAFLEEATKDATTPDEYLLEKRDGSAPVDQIKEGMRLEVQLEATPQYVWLVVVIQNVGGRLLLRWQGLTSGDHDFWRFYLDSHLHFVGWAERHDYVYRPPKEVVDEVGEEEKWNKVLMKALTDQTSSVIPHHVFKDQPKLQQHSFQEGWKLEAVHPKLRNQICPATVRKVIDKYYFVVEFDDLSPSPREPPVTMCCHANSPGLFPVRWCTYAGIRLALPKGWTKPDFSWSDYLTETGAEPAPDFAFTNEAPTELEFKRGMKLEAVNPERPGDICAATITRIIDRLMWVHLDSPCAKNAPNLIVDVESLEIFPVGWCESNDYELKPPKRPGIRKIMETQPEKPLPMTADEFRSATYSEIKAGEGGSSGWCPKIYFNHRCFSGPYLSKSRIAELPKCVGPGPIILVLKEVLTMLINVAYKSSRVLRELQLDSAPNPSMHQQVLKAKYKAKSYRAVVEICKHKDQVEEFCRQTCITLECCPYLISPQFVGANCPERCANFTKTKYAYNFGKKRRRKIGRPPGGHTNLEFGPKKPGKKRRKTKKLFVFKKKHTAVTHTHVAGETDSVDLDWMKEEENGGNGEEPKKKRKYTRHIPPPTDIKTRGAKLPKFNIGRPRRKRIAPETVVVDTRPLEPPVTMETKVEVKEEVLEEEPKPKRRAIEDMITLDTNPLYWSVQQVVDFMTTTDCKGLVKIFQEQEIDGQALLLLNLPTIQEHMELKLGPAVKVCHHIERVKLAFFKQYAQ